MLRLLVLLAGLSCGVVAQSASAPQFNFVPADVVAGQSYTLSWSGGNGSPVGITIVQGPSSALTQVLALTSNAPGTSFIWNTPTNYFNGNDYALMITQGEQFTVSTQFAITGGLTPPLPVSSSPPTNSAPPPSSPSTLSTSTIPSTQTTSIAASTSKALAAGAANGTSGAIPGTQKMPLGKSGTVGVIIGVLAIFAAGALMGLFVVAKKVLDKKAAAAAAAAGPDNAGITALTSAGGPAGGTGGIEVVENDAAQMSSDSVARQHYKQKQLLTDDAGRARSDSDSSAYSRSLGSPDTLVATPAQRMEVEDGRQSSSAGGDGNGEIPITPPGGWDDRAYGIHAAMTVHPGRLTPQYSGESGLSTASTRGKERRWSPPASKLRLQIHEG